MQLSWVNYLADEPTISTIGVGTMKEIVVHFERDNGALGCGASNGYSAKQESWDDRAMMRELGMRQCLRCQRWLRGPI